MGLNHTQKPALELELGSKMCYGDVPYLKLLS